MNVKTPDRRRPYDSELRQKQSRQTREAILEAVVRTMARGVADLSMPAVAREAGVSIQTIYRHFGSKAGLVRAVAPYAARKAGLVPDHPPASVDGVEDEVRTIFRRLDRLDTTLRAAMASELGSRVRREFMPERRAMHREMIVAWKPDIAPDDLERLADLSVILMSSAVFRAFKDYLGLGPDEAADRVAWAIRTLVQGPPKPEEGER